MKYPVRHVVYLINSFFLAIKSLFFKEQTFGEYLNLKHRRCVLQVSQLNNYLLFIANADTK